jgi:hypothetical protein
MAADGSVPARERITDGVAGVARLHEPVASWAEEPAEVVVGIETDRGLLVGALVAAGHQVIAVNPLAASRYRERHTISRAKSDRGDARMLADLVHTDRLAGHAARPGLVVRVGRAARGAAVGRKSLAVGQVAAEGGSGANLFRRRRLRRHSSGQRRGPSLWR